MLERFITAQEKLFSLQLKVSRKFVKKLVKLPGSYYLMFSIKMKTSQINATQINTREMTNKKCLYRLQSPMQQLQLLLGVALETVEMHVTF